MATVSGTGKKFGGQKRKKGAASAPAKADSRGAGVASMMRSRAMRRAY